MSALTVIELDTTAPFPAFGQAVLDASGLLTVPYSLDEATESMTADLQLESGTYGMTVLPDHLEVQIPPGTPEFSTAFIKVVTTDDVWNEGTVFKMVDGFRFIRSYALPTGGEIIGGFRSGVVDTLITDGEVRGHSMSGAVRIHETGGFSENRHHGFVRPHDRTGTPLNHTTNGIVRDRYRGGIPR